MAHTYNFRPGELRQGHLRSKTIWATVMASLDFFRQEDPVKKQKNT